MRNQFLHRIFTLCNNRLINRKRIAVIPFKFFQKTFVCHYRKSKFFLFFSVQRFQTVFSNPLFEHIFHFRDPPFVYVSMLHLLIRIQAAETDRASVSAVLLLSGILLFFLRICCSMFYQSDEISLFDNPGFVNSQKP